MTRLLSVAVVALALPVSSADAQVLARSAAPFDTQRVSIDSWGATIAFSQFDAATYQYRLAVIRGGGAPALLPVAPQPVPFDVDVGPGPDGRPLLVYTRCAQVTGSTLAGCDVFRYSFATRAETSIAGVNTSLEEHAPTVWKDRIAFARTRSLSIGAKAMPRIYSRRLDAPSARSRRLPMMPARECRLGFCRRTTYGTVEELELHGSRLAAVVRAAPGTLDSANVDVQLLAGGTVRRVAGTAVGAISVRKMYVGLSFEGDRLSYARSFFYASPDAVYRYDIGTRRSTAAALPRTTYGLAAAGHNRYLRLGTCVPACPAIVPAAGATPVAPGPFPLELTRTGSLHFAPARAPR